MGLSFKIAEIGWPGRSLGFHFPKTPQDSVFFMFLPTVRRIDAVISAFNAVIRFANAENQGYYSP